MNEHTRVQSVSFACRQVVCAIKVSLENMPRLCPIRWENGVPRKQRIPLKCVQSTCIVHAPHTTDSTVQHNRIFHMKMFRIVHLSCKAIFTTLCSGCRCCRCWRRLVSVFCARTFVKKTLFIIILSEEDGPVVRLYVVNGGAFSGLGRIEFNGKMRNKRTVISFVACPMPA